MLTISDGEALARASSLLSEPMRRLLRTRFDQLGGDITDAARFYVIEPGDLTTWLREALGFSLLENVADGTRYGDSDFTPGFEWIEDHGFCWELAFEFTADFTHVVLVENAPGVHRRLLDFCRAYAPQIA